MRSHTSIVLRRLLPALLLIAALVAPAAAHAAHNMQIGIADDGHLFGRTAKDFARAFRQAGAETVRITAPWGGIAPGRRSFKIPRGFNDSSGYDRRYDFTFLDRAIGAAEKQHLRIQLSLAGPGPYWASDSPRRRDGRWLPNAKRFANFARAVAEKYHGRIDAFILWNEPNEPAGLKPQRQRGLPTSADRYRDMVNAATPAIHSADPGAKVLMGALASTDLTAGGNHHQGTTPLAFLRQMGCVTRSYRPIRSGFCRRFRAPAANGIVLHPHGLKDAPTQRSRNPDYATIGDLKHFEAVLDRLSRSGRLHVQGSGRFPIYLAEFGYQTPPSSVAVSYATQALWLQQGSQIAWRDPRVVDLNWYVWRDEAGRGGWTSGLYQRNGRPKPSRTAYSLPFLANRSSFWGQVRPGGAHRVRIQGHGRHGGWHTLKTVGTDRWGGFQGRLRVSGAITLLRAQAVGGPTSLGTRP